MARDTRRPTAGARPVPLQLIPAATSFDFLEGAFRASQRARQVFLGFALAAIAGVGALILLGVVAIVGASQDRATLVGLSGQTAQMNQAIKQAGGPANEAELNQHLSERKTAVRAAVGGEVDVPALLKQLQQATPSGVQLTGITIGSSAGTAPTAGSASTQTSTNASRQVTITANVSSLPQVEALQTALSHVSLVQGVSAKWSGNVPSVTVTVTATIADSALTSRAQEIRAATPAGSTPATTAGGK